MHEGCHAPSTNNKALVGGRGTQNPRAAATVELAEYLDLWDTLELRVISVKGRQERIRTSKTAVIVNLKEAETRDRLFDIDAGTAREYLDVGEKASASLIKVDGDKIHGDGRDGCC